MKKILILAATLLTATTIHAQTSSKVKSGTCDFTDYYMISSSSNNLKFKNLDSDSGLVAEQESSTKFQTSWSGACYLDSSGHATVRAYDNNDENNYCDISVLDGPYITSDQVINSVNANTYSCKGNIQSVSLQNTSSPQGEHYYTFSFTTD